LSGGQVSPAAAAITAGENSSGAPDLPREAPPGVFCIDAPERCNPDDAQLLLYLLLERWAEECTCKIAVLTSLALPAVPCKISARCELSSRISTHPAERE
jgi:hypothetical protein